MKSTRPFQFLKLFYYLGGLFIFFGIVFYIHAAWGSLTDTLKIFTTLGFALAAFITGNLFFIARQESVGAVFFCLTGFLLPLGLFVTANILHWDNYFHLNEVSIFTFGLCTLLALLLQFAYPRSLFVGGCILFSTLLFFNLMDFLLYHHPNVPSRWVTYECMAIALSYILLGRYFDLIKKYNLTGLLYFLGAIMLLGAVFHIWSLLTGILIFLILFLSVPFRSQSFLYVAAVFLIFYILDISSDWIRRLGDFGWPLVLVLVGFIFMLVGYLIFSLQKKIKNR